MIPKAASPLEIVELISRKKISIYQAVDFVKRNDQRYLIDLKKLLSHKDPYHRLFAAWSIGEIGDGSSFKLLFTAYVKEADPNVRANIIRSLFYVGPEMISQRMIKKILDDDYDIVQLVAIKFLIFSKSLHNKFSFKYYFQQIESLRVKCELLRNINLFKYKEKSILLYLSKTLEESKNKLLRNETIKSIGVINSPHSTDILLNYYRKNKFLFESDDLLAYSFVVAIVSLCTSKAYQELYEAYTNHNNILLRYKVIEGLSSGGGPQSLLILKKILEKEKNRDLILELKKQIKTMKVLDI